MMLSGFAQVLCGLFDWGLRLSRHTDMPYGKARMAKPYGNAMRQEHAIQQGHMSRSCGKATWQSQMAKPYGCAIWFRHGTRDMGPRIWGTWSQGHGNRDMGPFTWDQGQEPGTGTRDMGPRTGTFFKSPEKGR